MEVEKFDDIKIYQEVIEVERIANEASSQVWEENKKMKIPLVFYVNGTIYFQLPSGRITKKSPFE